jgi:hypothetical protein
MTELSNFTTTSFGLVIAYLVPGAVGAYGLALWSPSLQGVLHQFRTPQVSVGLFLVGLLAALTVGLVIVPARYVLFERIWPRIWNKHVAEGRRIRVIGAGDLARLSKQPTLLSAAQAFTDEQYRYHQCWGGLTVVIPFVFFYWLTKHADDLSSVQQTVSVVGFVGLEITLAVGAHEALARYFARIRAVLGEP